MSEEHRFYVYQLFDGSIVQYVGKGTGRRLKNQMTRTGLFGEIVKRFKSEREAYKFEAKMIANLKPPLNRTGGGGGQRVQRRIIRQPKWFTEIERVGSRRYAARMLLRFDLRGHIDSSKLDAIRQVANGPRC